jgi:DNA-directed RNA polymerase specialized sigma24 family protein
LYAIHYIHDVDAAEDIVQECFSVLWEKMEQEGGEIVNIRSYLYTMVRNRSLDWLKQSSMFDTSLSPSDLEDRLPEEDVEERTTLFQPVKATVSDHRIEVRPNINDLPTFLFHFFPQNRKTLLHDIFSCIYIVNIVYGVQA